MRNTAEVIIGKHGLTTCRRTCHCTCHCTTVLLQSITGVSAINTLVAFYDLHASMDVKREVLFSHFVPDTTLITHTYKILQSESQCFCFIISPLQSTAGHRPLQLLAISLDLRLLASRSSQPSCVKKHLPMVIFFYSCRYNQLY
jgi:hypothetical protein